MKILILLLLTIPFVSFAGEITDEVLDQYRQKQQTIREIVAEEQITQDQSVLEESILTPEILDNELTTDQMYIIDLEDRVLMLEREIELLHQRLLSE